MAKECNKTMSTVWPTHHHSPL